VFVREKREQGFTIFLNALYCIYFFFHLFMVYKIAIVTELSMLCLSVKKTGEVSLAI
jgi:hypothetical protein